MSEQQPAAVSVSPEEAAPSGVFETPAYRNAIDKLSLAFRYRKVAIALTATGQSAVRYVTRRFLENLDDDTTLIRITEPCENVIDFMRRVIRAIGFEPRDLGVADLEKVFRLFLSFQKSHGLRTVLWVECTEKNDAWVLDKIRNLIEKEQQGGYGLLAILSGEPGLLDLLGQGPLGRVELGAGSRISLPPFSRDETREYVRRRVDATGRAAVDQLFSFQALCLLHDLTEGVPDVVAALTNRSLDLAGAAGAESISAAHVQQAYAALTCSGAASPANDDVQTVTLEGNGTPRARLIVRLTAEDVRELTVSRGRVLIGRSRLCDVRLDGPVISRHHALIDCSGDGTATLVDLSSTNGTHVNGRKVTEHCLSPGETIVIGDCHIEYLVDDGQEAPWTDRQPGSSDDIRLLQG